MYKGVTFMIKVSFLISVELLQFCFMIFSLLVFFLMITTLNLFSIPSLCVCVCCLHGYDCLLPALVIAVACNQVLTRECSRTSMQRLPLGFILWQSELTST